MSYPPCSEREGESLRRHWLYREVLSTSVPSSGAARELLARHGRERARIADDEAAHEASHEASRCMQCGRRTQVVDFALCDDCDDSDIPWGDDTDREVIAGWDDDEARALAEKIDASREQFNAVMEDILSASRGRT